MNRNDYQRHLAASDTFASVDATVADGRIARTECAMLPPETSVTRLQAG